MSRERPLTADEQTLLKHLQTRKEMEDTMSNDNNNESGNNTAQEAAEEAVETLEPFEQELPRDLMGGLRFIATGKTKKADEEGGDVRLAKSLGDLNEVEAVAKAEQKDTLREAVKKARKAVEAEYLANVSPAAYANAERNAERAASLR